MIIEYLLKRQNINNLNVGLLLILTSFAGGYMVSDFPKEFLNVFKHPIIQFFIFLCMNYILKYENEPIIYILLESLISVLLLQLLKYTLNKIYL